MILSQFESPISPSSPRRVLDILYMSPHFRVVKTLEGVLKKRRMYCQSPSGTEKLSYQEPSIYAYFKNFVKKKRPGIIPRRWWLKTSLSKEQLPS
jgi:hypothetical protein